MSAKASTGALPTGVVNPSAAKKKPYPLYLGGKASLTFLSRSSLMDKVSQLQSLDCVPIH